MVTINSTLFALYLLQLLLVVEEFRFEQHSHFLKDSISVILSQDSYGQLTIALMLLWIWLFSTANFLIFLSAAEAKSLNSLVPLVAHRLSTSTVGDAARTLR